MPILQAEPNIYPETLLNSGELAESGRVWWAVYTMSRQEKALARQLYSMQVPFYLPLTSKEEFVRGRRRLSHLPVFSNYLFIFGTEEERFSTLETNRVSRMLPVTDFEELVSDLQSLREVISSGQTVTIERTLSPGQRVRIKSGSMAGLEGTLLRRDKSNRLLIAVNYLQQGVSIEIDDFMVEPL